MKKLIGLALVIVGLGMWACAPAFAQQPKQGFQLPIPLRPLGQTSGPATVTTPSQLFADIQRATVADLQYAINIAKAQNNKLTESCWSAWLMMIQNDQNANLANGAAVAPPEPHVITDLERVIDLANALEPSSPFVVACAPLANQVKMNVAKFIASAVGGTAVLGLAIP